MKRLIILAATLIAGLSACDSLLDKEPLDRVTQFDYFKTKSDLELFSNPFYDNLLDKTPYDEQNDLLVQMTLSDILYGGDKRTVPNTGGGWSWGNLRRINTLLEYVDQCEDKDAVLEYTALSRFFRAAFYFDKVKRFGDVPWYDTQLGSADPDLYKARGFAGAGHDQDDRGCRLRHQQRRSDRGGDALPRQQMGGTGAESAVLPLRGNLPQIPRHQPRGTRLHLLSGRSRQGRQNDHRRRPLQDLFHQKIRTRTT